jgi:signal transduction histidine kinase
MSININIVELIILTLINVFGSFLIVLVLANSYKEDLYRWFSVMTVCLLMWVNSSYLAFNAQDMVTAVTGYRVNMVSVALFFCAFYVFYIEKFLKVMRRKFKVILFVVATILILLFAFSTNLHEGIVMHEWGNEADFGMLDTLFFGSAFIAVIFYIYFIVSSYIKLSGENKKKVRYFLIGTFLLIIFNVVFNIFSPVILETDRYQHLGDYSAVFFLISTAVAVVRRKFLQIKIATAAILISVLGSLLIIDIIALSDSLVEQVIKGVLFIFFLIISVILVRSILREIKQREQLQELSRQQKDIIDVMGHEIRTPLTAIVQELNIQEQVVIPKKNELIGRELEKKEQEKLLRLVFDTLETIDSASTHAVAIANDMLETARLDKGRFELNYEKFDLIKLTQEAIDVMKKTIKDKSIEIKFEPQKESLQVKADKARIREAIYALLNNAIKYRDQSKDKTKIQVSIKEEDSNVRIAIKDNGIGIKESDIKKLGKKFMRLDANTSKNIKRPGGTGLGLYVVKGIMKHHKGDLLISSPGIGQGSVFTLKFPNLLQ